MKKYGENPTMSEMDRNEYNRLRDKITHKNSRELHYKFMKQRNQGRTGSVHNEKQLYGPKSGHGKHAANRSSPFQTIKAPEKDLFYHTNKTTDTVDLGSESYKTFEEPIRNKSLLPKKS